MLYVGTAEATRYQLNKEGLIKILKVLGWSCASALIASLIAIIPEVNIPIVWIWLVPAINSGLITLKKFIDDK